MTIRCPNKECNTRNLIKNEILHNPAAKIKCPSCKKYFKPYDALPESEKEKLKNKKTNELNVNEVTNLKGEQTDISDNRSLSPVGWLVVHDEKTHSQTYDLKEGNQLIGRENIGKPCDIMIECDDKFMSRNHFSLSVRNHGGSHSYLLKDEGAVNGTFIDTKVLDNHTKQMRRVSPSEEVYIQDGAVIMAGRTKIILKTPKTSANGGDATRIVGGGDYPKTIII